jgi:ketosteroid isomerase-like protein
VACPTGQAKDEAALIQIEKTWARALDEHDAKALGCILADEFEDAGPDGKLTDRSTTLAKAANISAVHHQLSDLHAHVHGDLAYIRGLADGIDSQTKMITRVRFTDIYAYRDGRWQCVAGHESLVSAVSH